MVFGFGGGIDVFRGTGVGKMDGFMGTGLGRVFSLTGTGGGRLNGKVLIGSDRTGFGRPTLATSFGLSNFK
jgi:hypothetical protein